MKAYDHRSSPVTIGTHGWSGSCAPCSRYSCRNKTFSVGCFEWLPSAKKGMAKKGKVKVRVYGRKDNPVPVFEEAGRICQELDAGAYAGPKTVRIKNNA